MSTDVTSVTKSLDRIADALDQDTKDTGLTESVKRIAKAIDSESDTKSITDSLDAIADYIEENGIGGGGSDDFVEVTITNSEESTGAIYFYWAMEIAADENSPNPDFFKIMRNDFELLVGKTITVRILKNSMFLGSTGYVEGPDAYLEMVSGTAKLYEFEHEGNIFKFPYFDEDGQNIVIKYSGD